MLHGSMADRPLLVLGVEAYVYQWVGAWVDGDFWGSGALWFSCKRLLSHHSHAIHDRRERHVNIGFGQGISAISCHVHLADRENKP